MNLSNHKGRGNNVSGISYRNGGDISPSRRGNSFMTVNDD